MAKGDEDIIGTDYQLGFGYILACGAITHTTMYSWKMLL